MCFCSHTACAVWKMGHAARRARPCPATEGLPFPPTCRGAPICIAPLTGAPRPGKALRADSEQPTDPPTAEPSRRTRSGSQRCAHRLFSQTQRVWLSSSAPSEGCKGSACPQALGKGGKNRHEERQPLWETPRSYNLLVSTAWTCLWNTRSSLLQGLGPF